MVKPDPEEPNKRPFRVGPRHRMRLSGSFPTISSHPGQAPSL